MLCLCEFSADSSWVLDSKLSIHVKVSRVSFSLSFFSRYTKSKLFTYKPEIIIYLFGFFLFFFRATLVRAEAAAVEVEQGMKTMRSPPSHPPTMPTLLCCTSWSMSQVTPSIPCLIMACSTPTPTLSCPRS